MTSSKISMWRKTAWQMVRTVLVAAITITGAWSAQVAQAAPPYGKTPAGITDVSRDTTVYGDFMRAIWISPGTEVNYLGRQGVNLRAFFTATTFVKPSVTVDQYLALVGNYYPTNQQDLVLMRCQPSADQEEAVSPILATWPNVFSAILSDFQSYSCPPNPADGNNVMYCAAQGYEDSQQAVFVTGLLTAFTAANQIFQNSGSSPGAVALKNNYGIYPAFTGLGFSAAGSGMVSTMSTTQVLRESIVPEYLLKNVTLADAGCRCIQVPQYGNAKNPDLRHLKPVDPSYIWQKGKLQNDACHQIAKLGTLTSTANAISSDASPSSATSTEVAPDSPDQSDQPQ
jgi:hypothetical protein